MELVTLKLSEILPYKNNPRNNVAAIDAVAESIQQTGYRSRIIVDESHTIIAGHTRYFALQKLGWEEVQVQMETGMTEDQKRKYRLLDNKTGEYSEWDFEKLSEELENVDFGDFDFGFSLSNGGDTPLRAASNADGRIQQGAIAGNEEISPENYGDEQFSHICPRCGFRYNG